MGLRDAARLVLRAAGLYDRLRYAARTQMFPRIPPYDAATRRELILRSDPVRDQTLVMAILTLERESVPGSFAELGVHQGATSELIHRTAPDRTLYLFDTFEGFPEENLERKDERFKDTSAELVRRRLGNSGKVVIRKGLFPETAKGLEHERFALVMLDADLYQSTLDGLAFFYPRMAPGGYIFAHDYNSTESDRGVSRAVREFMAGKPEHWIEIPDIFGTALMRKV
jgi:O-methyltransferase